LEQMIERKRDKGIDLPAWHAWEIHRFGDRLARASECNFEINLREGKAKKACRETLTTRMTDVIHGR